MTGILYKTNKLRIESEYEMVSLIDNFTGETMFQSEFYGGADCGLLDSNNRWAIFGGEALIVWTPRKVFTIQELQWAHSLRMKNTSAIEVLTDPWSIDSAIWEINAINFEVRKIKEFNEYKDKEYTENVTW